MSAVSYNSENVFKPFEKMLKSLITQVTEQAEENRTVDPNLILAINNCIRTLYGIDD